MENKKKKNMLFRHLLNMPFIWILIIPMIILDIFVELYHQVGFRLCSIPLVKRSNYIKMDRQRLKYLSLVDKMGCAYCGYANGLAGYFLEIAARTEKYWCGIKHKKSKDFIEPEHHKDFVEYGDEAAYRKKYL